MISIILPCYNAEKTILETLNSIEQQKYKDFELICINDGSNDKSLEIIENFSNQIDFNMIILSRENKGFLCSLEEGISKAKGELIARIDSDDLWENNHLELIVKKFEEDSSVVLVGSNAIFINEENTKIGSSQQPTNIIKYLLKDSPFIHSSVVFKYSEYIKTKGYLIGEDEGSKHIADYNLWFELSKLGKCVNIPNYTVSYRVLENSMSRQMNRCINYKSRLSIMRKAYSFYKKYHFFFFKSYLKVNLRILQHCFFSGVFK